MHGIAAYEGLSRVFNNTYEAHGYNVILNALIVELVLTLMRIWDPKRDDVLSFPRARKLLRSQTVTKELKDRALKQSSMVQENIDQFTQIVDASSGNHVIGRLRALRNEVFAHTADHHDGPSAKYGHLDDVLNATVPAAQCLNLAVRLHSFGADEIGKMWDLYASRFWQAASRGVER